MTFLQETLETFYKNYYNKTLSDYSSMNNCSLGVKAVQNYSFKFLKEIILHTQWSNTHPGRKKKTNSLWLNWSMVIVYILKNSSQLWLEFEFRSSCHIIFLENPCRIPSMQTANALYSHTHKHTPLSVSPGDISDSLSVNMKWVEGFFLKE